MFSVHNSKNSESLQHRQRRSAAAAWHRASGYGTQAGASASEAQRLALRPEPGWAGLLRGRDTHDDSVMPRTGRRTRMQLDVTVSEDSVKLAAAEHGPARDTLNMMRRRRCMIGPARSSGSRLDS